MKFGRIFDAVADGTMGVKEAVDRLGRPRCPRCGEEGERVAYYGFPMWCCWCLYRWGFWSWVSRLIPSGLILPIEQGYFRAHWEHVEDELHHHFGWHVSEWPFRVRKAWRRLVREPKAEG